MDEPLLRICYWWMCNFHNFERQPANAGVTTLKPYETVILKCPVVVYYLTIFVVFLPTVISKLIRNGFAAISTSLVLILVYMYFFSDPYTRSCTFYATLKT